VLVMKNCGPKGYPGMAEVGNMGLPPKLLARGITDMVRISDARMSGTAYGTVVLHVAPEAMAGGPLGIVQGRRLHRARLRQGRLHLDVADEEIRTRLADRAPRTSRSRRSHGVCRAVYRSCAAGGRRLRFRLPGRVPRVGRSQAFPLSRGVPTLRMVLASAMTLSMP
jgi:dihydroxyacid dehydratase/phosphogluconate dehydratase